MAQVGILIDDWEDGDASEYSETLAQDGAIDASGVSSSTVYEGSYAGFLDGSSVDSGPGESFLESQSGLPKYPDRGEEVWSYIRVDGGSFPRFAGTVIGTQPNQLGQLYAGIGFGGFDIGFSSTFGSFNTSSFDTAPSTGKWYRLRVRIADEPAPQDVTAILEDPSDDSELGRHTATDWFDSEKTQRWGIGTRIESSNSAVVRQDFGQLPWPDDITNVSVTPTPGGIALSWTNNHRIADGIKLYRATSSGTTEGDYTEVADLDPSRSSYDDVGLTDGETYYYRLKPYVAANGGPLTAEEFDTVEVPGVSVSNATATSADLFWTDIAGESSYDLQHRKVYDDGSRGAWRTGASVAADATSGTDDGLQPGRTYELRVVGVDGSRTTASDPTSQVTTTSSNVRQRRVPATGWYVEIDHPAASDPLVPRIRDEPQFSDRGNDVPRLEIPIPKADEWRQFREAYPDQKLSLRAWKDGTRQPVEEFLGVSQTERGTVLKARAGTELENRARRSVQQEEKHVLAEDLITNETSYTANVDTPPSTTDTNVTILSVDGESEWDDLVGTPDATDPWYVTSGGVLTAYDISFWIELQGFPHLTASAGEVKQYLSSTQSFSDSFSLDYDIPDGDVGLAARISYQSIHDWSASPLAWGTSPAEIRLDGSTIIQFGDLGMFQYTPQEGAFRVQANAIAHESASGTATDETAASNDDTADDMTLLPASPSTGDEYYWSTQPGTEFDEIDLTLSQTGAGTYSITWEYYAEEYDSNDSLVDSGWRPIPNVSDGTAGFRQSGSVSWGLDDIVQDTQAGGSYVVWGSDSGSTGNIDHYVRARLSSFSSLSQQPLGQRSKTRGGPFGFRQSNVNGELAAGSHSVDVVGTGSGTAFGVDGVAVHDQRFAKDFPDTVNSDGYLDGPQSKPDFVRVETGDTRTIQQVVGGRLEASFDDVSNKQEVAISNDQGSSYATATNSQTVETDFASGSTRLRARFGLSRYGQRQQTPATGFNAQSVDLYDLKADLKDTPIVINQTYDGSVREILQELAEPEYIWTMDVASDGTLTVEWTQPGQRTADVPQDVVNYEDETTVEGRIHRAIVKGKSQPVRAEEFTANHGTAVDLANDELQRGREEVYDPSDDTQFVLGEDYELNWLDGTITTLSNGAMSDGATYEINYQHRPVGTYTTDNPPANPVERVFDFAELTTDRACEQVALQLVQDLDEPLVTASATLPAGTVDWSVVDVISLDALPRDEPYELADIVQTPANITLQLESRQSVSEVVSNIQTRLSQLSGEF